MYIAGFEDMSMDCLRRYDSMSVDLQLIPCSAVFKYIAGFEDMSRPYCILALVHLAEVFGTKLR